MTGCQMPGCCAQLSSDQSFALHGVTYDIELCGVHAQWLDNVLARFIEAGRERRPVVRTRIHHDGTITRSEP